jgi:hypothetical protein
MKNNKLVKSISLLTIFALVAAFSCKEEDRITVRDTQDITEEAVTDTYFQDMDDMAGVAVSAPSDTQFGAGRENETITASDSRFQCSGAPLTLTLTRSANSTKEIPQGVITVDFGTAGCTDQLGNVRKGKLTFTYSGRRFVPGSTVVTTTDGYSINGVKLEGTRTLTNVSGSTSDAPKFNIVLANGKATYSDGQTATRESNITTQWVRAASPINDELIVDQSSTASGTTRGGRKYQVSLLKQLEFKRTCGVAVSGIKKYVIDSSKEITIDYGDGTCDKSVTVTINGITRTLTVN